MKFYLYVVRPLQMLYKYLPFPYGMNAMRETIGGLYKMDYWKDLGALGIYVLISLFIGLVVAIPFRKLNHIIEKNKEGRVGNAGLEFDKMLQRFTCAAT